MQNKSNRCGNQSSNMLGELKEEILQNDYLSIIRYLVLYLIFSTWGRFFFNFHSIFSFFSNAQIYTDHNVPLLALWVCKPDFGRINLTNMRPFFLRCGLADVLNTLQRINGVRTAQDTRSKHYGQGVSWHAVCLLLQGNPENISSKWVVHHKKRKRPMFNPAVTL